MIRLNTNLMKQRLDYTLRFIKVSSEKMEEKEVKDVEERRKDS